MEGVDAKTLLGLIRTYGVAIRELHAMDDPAVEELIGRLEDRKREAALALTDARFAPAHGRRHR
jgi:hypothetical protein